MHRAQHVHVVTKFRTWKELFLVLVQLHGETFNRFLFTKLKAEKTKPLWAAQRGKAWAGNVIFLNRLHCYRSLIYLVLTCHVTCRCTCKSAHHVCVRLRRCIGKKHRFLKVWKLFCKLQKQSFRFSLRVKYFSKRISNS